MANYTQAGRFLAASTPLGKDVLLLTAFQGEEELSRLFSYRLEFLSTNQAADPKAIVGKAVTWTVQPVGKAPRYFNGFVSRFSAGALQVQGLRYYWAEVVPWLWFLGRGANCRIFQNKTAPEVIEQVFRDLGFSDYKLDLKGTYPKLEYCVQYRETHLDFVSRLMEEFGIFYFFQHAADKHTLVLADHKGAYKDCAQKTVEYAAKGQGPQEITAWEHRYTFRTGKWAQTDYNFETPSTSLLTNTKTVIDVVGADKFEVFDYPGRYGKTGEGTPITKVRMEAEEADYDTVEAAGGCNSFTPGGKFTLAGHEVAGEKGKGYVITSIRHSALDESYTAVAGEPTRQSYTNRYTCIPDAVTFRPARLTPRPVVRGPQTAVVVGPKGEEIYTDKYGRVKVQFFWDRLGKKDENSSCWVRVAELIAGKQWGMVYHPRIGQEVMVEFLEGDPDRPLITGRVYNAEQMPPYPLPGNQTQSGFKSRSSKGGAADNFNELRFEDKKGSEEVYFHAEKDFNRVVENNDTLKVGFEKKDKGNQTIEVFNSQSLKVGCPQASEGSQTIEVWKDRTEAVKTGNEKVTIEKGNRDVNVKMGNDTHKVDMGNRVVELGMGNDTLTIKMGNQTTKLNLGASSTEALQSIELKVGQSSLKVDQMGVTIKGMMIQVEGQIQTQVKGLMMQVQGTAMTQIQGGITMIG